MTEALRLPEGLDTSKPSPARIYDYMLRGTHHFDVDEAAAKRIVTAVPEIKDCAWSNRGFHQRAAAWIARQGVEQFLDIGSGLPTIGNTHDVVKKIHPDARVVYVDNDPMVELFSQTILDPGGTVSVICGDLRDPDSILGHPSVRALLDSGEPTGLLMTAVLMFVADSSDPWSLVSRYVDAVGPGSYLSLSHLTDDAKPPVAVSEFRSVFDHATEHMYFRSRTAIAKFFEGLEIAEPYPGGAVAHLQRSVGRGGCGAGRQRRVPLAVLRGGEGPVTPSVSKPTPGDLGIDLTGTAWERSGEGAGSIEVAFPLSERWSRGDWVLMRVAGDPADRVLVFDRNEWECFIDGARNGEFDDAAGLDQPVS